jgi:tetratricopeptide (TPR) repeat protein
MIRRLVFLCAPAALLAQELQQPVAIVVRAEGGVVVRAGNPLGLGAKAGDFLFAGDALRSEKGTIRFSFCPDKSTQTLGPGGDALFEASAVRVRAGALTDKQAAALCVLPTLPREYSAGQYHNGASTTRDLRAADPPAGSFASRAQALPEAQRTAMMAELAPVDQAIAASPGDAMAHLARAGILEKYRLAADAAEAYQKVYSIWPDAVGVRTRLFVLEKAAEKDAAPSPGAAPAATGPRRTFALLVGVSSYANKDIRPLNFAHKDAELFRDYLKSSRGGSLPDENLIFLTNAEATTSAIRKGMDTIKSQATANDTVLMLFATHGTVVTAKGQAGAYIVSYDSDPENLADTAVTMKEVQQLVQEDLAEVSQVMAFVDVCHAGTIGTIPLTNNKRINSIVDRLAETEAKAELFLFLASRPNETSEEGPQYGGGHGAFSYFLMDALNGPGDIDKNGEVTIDELIEYTQGKVFEATFERQRPREAGKYTGSRPVANTKQPGIAMNKYTPVPPGGTRGTGTLTLAQVESSDTRSLTRAPIPRVRISPLKEAVDFEEALTSGRLLASADRNAITGLRQLRGKIPAAELLAQRNRLQATLEDAGQQVLLRYLTGEQVPQTRGDFITGAAYFATARQLAPESLFLEARQIFCEGRAALFEKSYSRGQDLLERAIRLDPDGAYTYNALGIAYLEQAIYDKAAQAFEEAIKRAPFWAYPRHNLALTQTQAGDYQGAIRGYQEAMRRAPSYSYLPYNLGLVYQRINRRREAEAAFREAIKLNSKDGMPYNALGYLNASTGRAAEAEKNYQQAIALDPDLIVAQHNLGALYAERMRRPEDAIAQWRRILEKNPDYLPSRLSLAKTLAAAGRNAEAIAEYEIALKARPEYAAARLELARLQLAAGDRDGALGNLREVARQQPANADVWERIGDAEKAAGRAAESREAYQKALDAAVEGSAKKRIRRKM